MEMLIWILFVIFYVGIKIAKITAKTGDRSTKPNVPRTTTPAKTVYTRNTTNGQRSFAAMPKQQAAVPNVESNCSADDKHRYENNLSKHNMKRSSAIPNVPNSSMHIQPKMSGNRKTAKQRYMGDPVPRGNKVLVCGYCAAENLVPTSARNEYKCYFCHYDI